MRDTTERTLVAIEKYNKSNPVALGTDLKSSIFEESPNITIKWCEKIFFKGIDIY